MDLHMAPTIVDGDENSRDPVFFMYIQRMQRISRSSFSHPCVWVWILPSDTQARQSVDFVKRHMPKY